MHLRYFLRASALFMGASAPTMVLAQSTIPNFGNFQDLRNTFRVGIQVTNQQNGFSQQAAFGRDRIEDIEEFIDPLEIEEIVGTQNARFGAITTVFDLRGATAIATFAQNGTTLNLSFVSPDGDVISQGNGGSCAFSFTGPTRDDAFDALEEAVESEESPTSQAFLGCLSRAFIFSPADPLAGNPNSLQATLTRSALDLTNGDSAIEEGANTAGDPWIVGATYTMGSAGRFDIERFDGRVQRSFRLFEGNRALLKFDLPFNYSKLNGSSVYSAQIGLGLEVPVIAQRWSLEPRVAYGVVASRDAGSVGHIAQVSLTSRYLIEGLGRGRLVIGNMIGYSQTLDPPVTEANINPELKNISLRNGVAYELPLKSRIGGRLSSLRASYGFTNYFGDDLRNNSFHEASLSFGLRGREESIRAARDLIRFNLNTVQARGYSSYTAGLGFRF
jgi:hypothetical protein